MELLGGNGHGVPGRSTQGKSHGLSSSSRCKLRCSAHHCLQAVHLPSWQQQSASRASIRWKMRTAERRKRRRSARWACGPSQLRLSGGRPTGRFLLTLMFSTICINFSKAQPPPRSEGCRAFDFSDRPPSARRSIISPTGRSHGPTCGHWPPHRGQQCPRFVERELRNIWPGSWFNRAWRR